MWHYHVLFLFCAFALVVPPGDSSGSHLLDLPPELKSTILSHLSHKDVSRMRRVHSELDETVRSDKTLPYWGTWLKWKLRHPLNPVKFFSKKENLMIARLLPRNIDFNLDSMSRERLLALDDLFAREGMVYNLGADSKEELDFPSLEGLCAAHKLILTEVPVSHLRHLQLPMTLKKIKLLTTDISTIDGNDLPLSLESFLTCGDDITSVTNLARLVNLKSLKIEDSSNAFIPPRRAEEWPPHLKTLRLSLANNDDVLEGRFALPNTIETLTLIHAPWQSMQHIAIPPSVLHLDFQFCKLVTLKGLVLPPRLKTIKLSGTKIESLDGAVFPDTIEVIELGTRRIERLKVRDLPRGVKVLLTDRRKS